MDVSVKKNKSFQLPSMKRIEKGYEIYIKNNLILLFNHDEKAQFVIYSRTEDYLISIFKGVWKCTCKDFEFRGNKENGVFLCKHCYAALFLLAEMEQGICRIQLTKGMYALVDKEDFDWLNQWKWYAYDGRFKNRDVYYAIRDQWIPAEKIQKNIRMHRLILKAKNGQIVDHINGNGLDNRRSNLRIVTHRENCQNMHGKYSSKYPGVSFNRGKWVATISINKKRKYLGRYAKEIEAYNAYKKAVFELTGEMIDV